MPGDAEFANTLEIYERVDDAVRDKSTHFIIPNQATFLYSMFEKIMPSRKDLFMGMNKRPDTMERITTVKLAEDFMSRQLDSIRLQSPKPVATIEWE